MALKLMYITNRPKIAQIVEKSGVNRVFVDMEYIGKEERQPGMDTVKSHHTIVDVANIRPVINKSELLVRVNPIGCYSKQEIDDTVSAGADVIMLPMFRTSEDICRFIDYVGGRAKTMLLVETKEAAENIDSWISLSGIDEIHIGLNDLHLAYEKKFMFELLTDGTVDKLCKKISQLGIPYGFGGIARLGYGMIPAEMIITEHYRLGSKMAILSRSFCNANNIEDIDEIRTVFAKEVGRIRDFENRVSYYNDEQFEKNHQKIASLVQKIVCGC